MHHRSTDEIEGISSAYDSMYLENEKELLIDAKYEEAKLPKIKTNVSAKMSKASSVTSQTDKPYDDFTPRQEYKRFNEFKLPPIFGFRLG